MQDGQWRWEGNLIFCERGADTVGRHRIAYWKPEININSINVNRVQIINKIKIEIKYINGYINTY